MSHISIGAVYTGCVLRVFGKNLEYTEIDDILSIAATDYFRRGDIVPGGGSRRKSGMWGLRIDGGNASIGDDIFRLIEKFRPECLPLTNLPNVDSCRLSLMIEEKTDISSLEIGLEPSEIANINRLGAQLYITYFSKIDRE